LIKRVEEAVFLNTIDVSPISRCQPELSDTCYP